MIHKATFLLSYFSVTKRRAQGGEATSERRRRDGVYQKSSKRAFPSLCELTPRARVSRKKQCVASACGKGAERKSAVSRYPQFQLYHACEHITRDNQADSCTHCLHARIIGVAGINTYAKHVCWRRRDGHRGFSLCTDGIKHIFFAFSVC